MTNKTATELADALRFARAVREALPVDPAADALVGKLMQRRAEGYVVRKLTRKQ